MAWGRRRRNRERRSWWSVLWRAIWVLFSTHVAVSLDFADRRRDDEPGDPLLEQHLDARDRMLWR